ncbi:transcriptional regulator [Streptomyces sp. NPDC057367]|uniref:transcriptional regulator n=1 Tax=Streptomyces sp. NPDC057367 TaxID=3346108 RepID=UPI0036359DA6
MDQVLGVSHESVAVDLTGAATAGVAARDPGSCATSESAQVKPSAVEDVPISSIMPGVSLRSRGPDAEHVARLAEMEGSLPPILVNRCTMHVIDGMHRLMAAFVKGQRFISVEFFEGSTEDAFLRAVQANVTHGLPLSQADRRAAAAKIVKSHPHLSDRAVARASGLGAKTVAAIRRQSDGVLQLHARVGRDGKVRPLSSDEGRKRAAELIIERPDASLREIARLAGLSPATVSDVKRRLQAGEAPVVGHGQAAHQDKAAQPAGVVRSLRTGRTDDTLDSDPHDLLEKLLRDPSLRHKEEGRNLLRLLHQNAVGMQQWSELSAAVPPHCGALVMNLARQYAETWLQFAQNLDEQLHLSSRRTVGE